MTYLVAQDGILFLTDVASLNKEGFIFSIKMIKLIHTLQVVVTDPVPRIYAK